MANTCVVIAKAAIRLGDKYDLKLYKSACKHEQCIDNYFIILLMLIKMLRVLIYEKECGYK